MPAPCYNCGERDARENSKFCDDRCASFCGEQYASSFHYCLLHKRWTRSFVTCPLCYDIICQQDEEKARKRRVDEMMKKVLDNVRYKKDNNFG